MWSLLGILFHFLDLLIADNRALGRLDSCESSFDSYGLRLRMRHWLLVCLFQSEACLLAMLGFWPYTTSLLLSALRLGFVGRCLAFDCPKLSICISHFQLVWWLQQFRLDHQLIGKLSVLLREVWVDTEEILGLTVTHNGVVISCRSSPGLFFYLSLENRGLTRLEHLEYG